MTDVLSPTFRVNYITSVVAPYPFSTNFPATNQNPMVDDGRWIMGKANGLSWTDPQVVSGVAYATMITHSVGFVDSIAHRTGFPADHWSEGVIRYNGGTKDQLEVELFVRMQITANNARGYEIDIVGGSNTAHVVRWNGPRDSFTMHNSAHDIPITIANGDRWRATVIGNLLTVTRNGSPVAGLTNVDLTGTNFSTNLYGGTTGITSTWTDGNPGFGLWNDTGAINTSVLGWDSWGADIVNSAPSYFPASVFGVVQTPAAVNGKNTLSSVTPSAWNPGSVGAISDNIVAHYSGGTGDGTKVWVYGGGHTDCAYNGLHLFDFAGTTAPVGWALRNAPSAVGSVDTDGSATYGDGLPASAHTYGGQCVLNGRYFRFGGSIYNSGSDPGYCWVHNGTAWVRLPDFPNGSFGGAVIALQPNAAFPQGKILALDRFGITQQGYAFFTPNSTYTGGTWGTLKSVAGGNWTYDPYATHQPLTNTTSKGLMVGGDGNWSFDIDWTNETCLNKTSRSGIPTNGRGGMLFWDSVANCYWFMASNNLGVIYSVDPSSFSATAHTLTGTPLVVPDTGGGEYGHWGRGVFMQFGAAAYIGLVTGRSNNPYVVRVR